MSEYFILDHVHVCTTPDAAVILDLRADQYYGLDRQQSRILSKLVHGWPELESIDNQNDPVNRELIEQLVEKKILTKETSLGKAVKPVRIRIAAERIHEWDSSDFPSLTVRHVRQMVLSCATAYTLFRFRSLAEIVERTQERKRINLNKFSRGILEVRELVRVYRALRPFFYSVRDKCLFDSIVLVEFLAAYEIYPTWVIGVTPMPFAAHSWVQIDNYVLNGPPEFVSSFVPILAI
jgi:hypothetical protein